MSYNRIQWWQVIPKTVEIRWNSSSFLLHSLGEDSGQIYHPLNSTLILISLPPFCPPSFLPSLPLSFLLSSFLYLPLSSLPLTRFGFMYFYSHPTACSSDWKAISSEVGWSVNILFLRFVQQCLFRQKMKRQLKSLHVKNTVFSLLLPRQIICLSKGFFLDYSFYYWDLVWISQVCFESYSFSLHHQASLGKCLFLSSKLRKRQKPLPRQIALLNKGPPCYPASGHASHFFWLSALADSSCTHSCHTVLEYEFSQFAKL